MSSFEPQERRYSSDPEAALLLALAEELNSSRRSDLFHVYRRMLERDAREKDLLWKVRVSVSACVLLVLLSIWAAVGNHGVFSWYHAGVQIAVGVVGILAGCHAVGWGFSRRRHDIDSELQGAMRLVVTDFSSRLLRACSMASREQEFTYSARGLLP